MNLRPLVLALVERRHLYGYEITQQAKLKGALVIEEGTLYPLLHKLEAEGLLRAKWRRAPNGKDRKYYTLTRRGKTALARARSDWKSQVTLVTRLLLGGSNG